LHPQTHGKDERFHRSFKAEVLAQHDDGIHAIAWSRAFAGFRGGEFVIVCPLFPYVRPFASCSLINPV
jgi:hypothetical protein